MTNPWEDFMPDSPRPIGSNSKRRDPIVFDNKNPIFACDDDPIRTALDRATESVFGSIAPAVRAACNVVQPDATPRNPMQPNHDMRKTKPIPPPAGFDLPHEWWARQPNP
jgi:hypothetical protein